MTKTDHGTNSQPVPAVLGIDLAKNSAHVHGIDESGRSLLRPMRPAQAMARSESPRRNRAKTVRISNISNRSVTDRLPNG